MSGRYRTIVADPPWPFQWSGGGQTRVNGRGERHVNHNFRGALPYPVMSIDDIAALPIGDLAESDAHLYLWLPDSLLIDGVGARIIDAWGFKRGRLLIWKKRNYGLGFFPRPQHEAVIVCKRGSLTHRVRDVGSVQEWWHAKGHSRKPEAFLDLVERASPGPYLELFARRQRLGWDTYGNEALEHVSLTATDGEASTPLEGALS